MKKMLGVLLAAGTFWFAASLPAAAQSDSAGAVVKVPFSFIVGNRLMPAGSYRIAPQTADWSVVTVTNINKPVAAFVTTQAWPQAKPMTNGSQVQFVSYFGQHFLQQIALPGRDARQVRVTQAEAERTVARLNLMATEPANVTK